MGYKSIIRQKNKQNGELHKQFAFINTEEKMSFLDDLKGIFYPRTLTCSVCKRENFNGKTVCDGCYESLPFQNGAICDHCGRATCFPTEYCDYCKNKQSFIDGARSVYRYEEPINTLIQRLKYGGEKYLAEEFALEMRDVFLRFSVEVDGIVFVPATKSRVFLKGYNQGEVIAKEFSKLVEIPIIENALVKSKETHSQVGLSVKERKKNLRGSFKVIDKKAIAVKNLLIIDDVMTTGSTAEAIAEKLKKAGANKVYLLIFYLKSSSSA